MEEWEFGLARTADPKTLDDLTALPIFGGKRQRRSAPTWLAALKAARENPGTGDEIEPPNGPPAPARWARRRPEAAARLDAARAALRELSERVTVPAENLVTPDLVRRLCWDWDRAGDDAERSDEEERRHSTADDTAAAVDEFLAAGQARNWQRELAVPVLAAALQPPPKDSDDVSPAAQ